MGGNPQNYSIGNMKRLDAAKNAFISGKNH